MTSEKTKQNNLIFSRLSLLALAFLAVGLGMVLFAPKSAHAAINPDFTSINSVQQKLKLNSSLAPKSALATKPVGEPSSTLAKPMTSIKSVATNQSGTTTHQSGQTVTSAAAGVAAKLAPPSGKYKTLPQVSAAKSARKFIAKQNKKRDRWVEVDLSRQKIMLWNGSHLDDTYAVSTGVWGHLTPTGTYYVYLHVRSQTMSGPGYSLPNVQYVQYFYGDYSLHGTWWHNNFGHPMSHGCVNLPTYKARELWYWAPQRLKVVIHQ